MIRARTIIIRIGVAAVERDGRESQKGEKSLPEVRRHCLGAGDAAQMSSALEGDPPAGSTALAAMLLSAILWLSIGLRMIAALWSLALVRTFGDRRLLAIAAILAVSSARPVMRLLTDAPLAQGMGLSALSVGEITSALASALALPIIAWFSRVLHREAHTRETLAASEERYRTLFELSPDLVMMLAYEDDGRLATILDANSKVRELIGYHPEEVIGMRITELLVDDDDPIAREVPRRGTTSCETWLLGRDRTRIPCEASLSRARVNGEDVVLATIRSLSAAKRAAQQVRASHERLATAERIAGLASVEWSPEEGIIHVSDNLYALLGTRPNAFEESFEGYLGVVNEQDRALVRRTLAHVLEHGGPVEGLHRIVRPDGDERVLSAVVAAVDTDMRGARRVVATLQDVTEMQRRAAEQRETNVRFRQVIENIDQGFYLHDLETGDCLYCSPAWERISGLARSATMTNPLVGLTITHPDDRSRVLAYLATVRRGEPVGSIEYRIVRRDGEVRWLSARSFVIRDETTDRDRIGGIITDITKEKIAHEALLRAHEELLHAQRIACIGSGELRIGDGDGYWSTRTCEMFGVSPDTAAGLDAFLALVHEDDLCAVRDRLHTAAASLDAGSLESRMKRPSGETWWLAMSWEPVYERARHEKALRCIFQDITERKRFEELLRSIATVSAVSEEHERNRLAAELHDGAVQHLGLCRIRLGQLRADLAGHTTAGLVDEIVSLVDGAIGSARSLLHELSPPVLTELGLVAAVESLAEDASTRSTIEIDVHTDAFGIALSRDLELLMFQTIRELVANIEKHSRARHASVSLAEHDGTLALSVRDDGIGIGHARPIAEPSKTGGFGLFSIRERLSLLGGRLRIDDASPGTRIEIEVPVGLADALLAPREPQRAAAAPQTDLRSLPADGTA
jgi:PAS domain S-box-containing protein